MGLAAGFHSAHPYASPYGQPAAVQNAVLSLWPKIAPAFLVFTPSMALNLRGSACHHSANKKPHLLAKAGFCIGGAGGIRY